MRRVQSARIGARVGRVETRLVAVGAALMRRRRRRSRRRLRLVVVGAALMRRRRRRRRLQLATRGQRAAILGAGRNLLLLLRVGYR